MLHRILLALALLCTSVAPLRAGPIENLRPGEWYQVPNSKLQDKFPNPIPPGNGPEMIMTGWSGGAYDSKRDRLIVWGGGHADYSGNEIYVFDVNTLVWQRLTNPSADVGGNEISGYYPDGQPRSRHTYADLQYLGPPFDRFCAFGGASLYPASSVVPNVDCFNFDTVQWSRYRDKPQPGNGYGECSAYDPVRGHGWSHGVASGSRLREFDPIANTWTLRGELGSAGDVYLASAEIDPVRRRFIAIGGAFGLAVSWNIDAPGTLTRTNLATTGATSIQNEESFGLTYDSASDRFVAWNGGADVYVLNLDTLVWSRVSPAATNQVIPTAANRNGTFGRFRYMPSKNAFIVVNQTYEDVYIYKLSAGGGSPTDSIPPASTSDLRPR